MSKLSLMLQSKSLAEMAKRKPYVKKLAGVTYEVLPNVYKGSTDTELICKNLKIRKNEAVWDIGTGTGLVALYAKRMGAGYVLATDLNPDAVKNARRNATALGLEIDVRKADVFGTIAKKFDLIIFNPPFTDHAVQKTHDVSFWDKDHLTVKKFFKGVRTHLTKNGRALICWSSFAKTHVIKTIAKNYGFSLTELARKTGKRNFVYYVYKLKTLSKAQ